MSDYVQLQISSENHQSMPRCSKANTVFKYKLLYRSHTLTGFIFGEAEQLHLYTKPLRVIAGQDLKN